MDDTRDGREMPAIDRFDEYARTLFADLRLSGRTPVAVVGSGMSVSYGGVTWSASVKLALEEAERQIKAEQDEKHNPSARNKIRLARALGGVSAMLESKYPTAPDKYLALDIAKDAMAVARSCEGDRKKLEEDKPHPTFTAFMQRLFVSDTHFIAATLKARFCLSDEEATNLFAKVESEPGYVQSFACYVYRLETLKELAVDNTQLLNLCIKIKRQLNRSSAANADCILPIDRRSLLCIFLYGLDKESLHKKYAALVDNFDKAIKVNPEAFCAPPPRPLIDPIRALYDELGVRRFITLNFDFELENATMMDDLRTIKGRAYTFKSAIDDGSFQCESVTGSVTPGSTTPKTPGVTRRFSDGLAASSDIYAENAVARLFEFALNSPDYRAQILHLHGRADMPETMLLTEDDLNRIYRRNPQTRTTLEHALDVVLTGNAVLFAGIGLTEPEITRALRMLVSEGRATPANPAFALMAYDKGTFVKGSQGGTESWRHQMALFRQYGIHLIDAGHARYGNYGGLPEQLYRLQNIEDALNKLRKALKRTTGAQRTKALAIAAARKALAMAIKDCGKLSIVSEIAIDNIAWANLYKRMQTGADAMGVCEIGLALDYIGKLSEKLYSFCAEQQIKRLAVESADRFISTSLIGAKNLPFARETRMPLEWLPQANVRHDVKLARAQSAIPGFNVHAKAILDAKGVRCFLAPLGWGKGELICCLKERLENEAGNYVVINCNFALEFESAIIQILRFVWFASNLKDEPLKHPVIDRIAKLDQAMKAGPQSKSRPTIILTGIERLIDSVGHPVTPEFEIVLRVLIQNARGPKGWRLRIIGTPECAPFLRECGATIGVNASDAMLSETSDASADNGLVGFLLKKVTEIAENRTLPDKALVRQFYAASLASCQAMVPNGARSDASSAVLKIILERWHDIAFVDKRLPPDKARARAEFDKTILQSLAFIGQPVERAVLLHMPAVIAAAKLIKAAKLPAAMHPAELTEAIEDACTRLADFGLILRIKPFQSGSTDQRVALHRSVLAEIRDRVGVRSGDEMLSNSFALTLALSMPTDLVVADTDTHHALKDAVGHLRGAWKDVELPENLRIAFEVLREAARVDDASKALRADNALLNEQIGRLERLVCLTDKPMQPGLRAAAGIVRGFFTAATLVAMIPDGATRDEWTFGEFEQHKRRIANLLARVREVQDARSLAEKPIAVCSAKIPDCEAHLRQIKKVFGAALPLPPLYSGELIWMLNELAVISLLQGNLYTANQAFREADRALTKYKGRGVRQSWRRLEINRALVRIERGRINQARLSLVSVRNLMAKTRPSAEWEDQLTAPLITGYLGLCDFLGGHYARAEETFKSVIAPLIETDQQRALALFYWRTGELYLNMRRWKEADKQLRLGLAVAEAGRQMDVVWRIRISLTKVPDAYGPQMVEAILREAHGYANVMDMPRVAVLVHNRRANLKLDLGDMQSAASFATQAMQVATSNGMVLNRISSRTLMGRILLRQGDPSGEYLLRRAIAHADRIGYQLHVDRAQEALLEIRSKAHQ